MKEKQNQQTQKEQKVNKAPSNQEKIAKLQADLDHWKNEYYRAYADMKNLRDSIEKDHKDVIKYRAAGFIENLLPILDGFHMALSCEATSPEMKNFLTGFEFIYRNMVSVLENEGVSEISPKVGDMFDSNTMSAIEVQYDEGKPNRVLKVNTCGYKLHDRLIRPSIVVVSTDKKETETEKLQSKLNVDA